MGNMESSSQDNIRFNEDNKLKIHRLTKVLLDKIAKFETDNACNDYKIIDEWYRAFQNSQQKGMLKTLYHNRLELLKRDLNFDYDDKIKDNFLKLDRFIQKIIGVNS
jgi:hypothetical protein